MFLEKKILEVILLDCWFFAVWNQFIISTRCDIVSVGTLFIEAHRDGFDEPSFHIKIDAMKKISYWMNTENLKSEIRDVQFSL